MADKNQHTMTLHFHNKAQYWAVNPFVSSFLKDLRPYSKEPQGSTFTKAETVLHRFKSINKDKT